MIRLLGCAVAVALFACSAPKITGTSCDTTQDCNLFDVAGKCEPSGFCSYPDATCTGGRRYSPGAGDMLANTCLGGELPCGGKDQVCCGAGSCGPDLACVGETTASCQCGADAEPCCGGTTCDSGLACGTSGTCAAPLGVLQVAVGKGHICALRTDHTVTCWGYDTTWGYDAPGHALPVLSRAPTKVANLTDVAEIRAAEEHTCARKTDNTLWCWGHNEHGQLGDGTTTNTPAAVQVAGITGVQLFDGGTFHTCAVASYNGTPGVWCWGRGGQKNLSATATPNANLGRLGNNAIADSPVPVAVDLSAAAPSGQTVKALSTGGFHSCMVMSDDTVWCWGRGTNGELGTTAAVDTKVPVQVNLAGITIPGGVTIAEVSCSDGGKKPASTCLRLSNGSTYCWGQAADGQLGDGTTTQRNSPTTAVLTGALGAAKLVSIVAGITTRCGRGSDGTVVCWGLNQRGLVGIGVVGGTMSTPSRVLGLTGVSQLDMSHHTACAVDAMHRLWCWGNNGRGQIKFDTPQTQTEASVLVPVEIKLP